MADYVRRAIAPRLVGIDSGTLEILVGMLEIAVETRELDSEREDIADLLTSCSYCVDHDSANSKCDQIFSALKKVAEEGESSASDENEDQTDSCGEEHDQTEGGRQIQKKAVLPSKEDGSETHSAGKGADSGDCHSATIAETSSAKEDGGNFCCRICLEECTEFEAGSNLIQPCLCAGSAGLVHRDCLDTWRATKQGNAFSHCTTCKFKYKLQEEEEEMGRSMLLFVYRMKIARDLCFLGAFVALLVTLCAYGAAEMARYADFASQQFVTEADAIAGTVVNDGDVPSDADVPSEPQVFVNMAKSLFVSLLILPETLLGDLSLMPLHDDNCPFVLWFGSGLLLFLVLLGIMSIVAWLLKLLPNDFEVHWPRCNCFIMAGPLVIFAVMALAFVGLVMGVSIGIRLGYTAAKRHANVTWLRDETKRHIVQDLRDAHAE